MLFRSTRSVRLLDVNWIWATGLTVFHAVESVAVPIVLAEALFPARAREPWLTPGARRAAAAGLAIVSAIELALFGFAQFHDRGYSPPTSWLLALGIAAAFVWLGLRLRLTAISPRTPPSLWRLRAFAFAVTLLFFFGQWVLPNAVPLGVAPIAFTVALVWFVAGRIRRWAADPSWGAEQRLGLASGVVGFFLALAPLIELAVRPAGKNTSGMVAFALLALVVLTRLAREAKASAALSAA